MITQSRPTNPAGRPVSGPGRAFRYTFVLAHILGFVGLCALQACRVNTPISQFDDGVAALCEGGLQEYRGHQFQVNLMDSYGAVRAECGGHDACTNGKAVWVIAGPRCYRDMAHEISHVVGNDWVDAHR